MAMGAIILARGMFGGSLVELDGEKGRFLIVPQTPLSLYIQVDRG